MATRREKIVLELEDNATSGLLRAAAAARLLDGAVDDVGGSSRSTSRETDRLGTSSRKAGKDFDELERRARRAERGSSALVDSIVALAPALVPVGAVAVPALAGLTAQLGFAAAAGGTMLLAFNGVGDALKALDAYQLEPTAANLAKVREEMDKLGPSGQDFVHELDSLEPKLKALKSTAQTGLFPGMTEGIDALLTRLPQIRRIIAEVSDTTGDLFADTGNGLAGDGFDEFFTYLQTNARPILTDTGAAVGNLAHLFANLVVATAPLQHDFTGWLRNGTQDLEDWSAGLQDSDGFTDFLDYVDQNGPKVADAVGSISGAIVSVVRAAAPMGGPTLQAITAVADVISRIADSPIGTPLVALASGLALVNRALAVSALAKDSLVTDLLYGRKIDGGRGTTALNRVTSGFTNYATGVRRANTNLTTSMRTANTELQAAQRDRQRIMARSTVGAVPGAYDTKGAQQYLAANRRVVAAEQNAAAVRRKGVAGVREATAARAAQNRMLLKGAAGAAALTVATSGLGDKLGVTNTVSLGLAGSFAGPLGAGAGVAVGSLLDVHSASNDAEQALHKLDVAVRTGNIAKISQQLGAARAAYSDQHTASGFFDVLSDGAKNIDRLLTGKSFFIDPVQITTAQTKVGNLTSTYRGLAQLIGKPLPANASPQQIQDFADQVGPSLDAVGISVKGLAASGNFAGLLHAADAIKAFDIPLAKTSARATELSTRLDAALNPKVGLDAARDELSKTIQSLSKLNGAAGVKGNSAAAMGNRQMVRTAASDTLALLNAQASAGKGADVLASTLQRSRRQIVQQGVAAGIGRREMVAYVNSLGLTPRLVRTVIQANVDEANGKVRQYLTNLRLTPSQIKTALHLAATGATQDLREFLAKLHLTPAVKKTVMAALTAAARGNISALQKLIGGTPGSHTTTFHTKADLSGFYATQTALNQLQNRTVYISTIHRGDQQAFGGIFDNNVRTFARGGVADLSRRDPDDLRNNHQPKLYPAGPTVRIFREEETPGLAFIPITNPTQRKALA